MDGRHTSSSGGGAHFLLNLLSSILFPLLFPHKDDEQSLFLNLPDTVTLIFALQSQLTVKPISAVRVTQRRFGLMIVKPIKYVTANYNQVAIRALI